MPTENGRKREPFRFCSSLNLTLLTDRRAADLHQLLGHLRVVSGSVIYFHTHHFLVQHQYVSPEPPNDFAFWVTHDLQEPRLGEELAAIDMVQFRTIRALRERIVATIERFVAGAAEHRVAPPEREFHFRESVSFVVPTGHVASSPAELATCIAQVGFGALMFHFFDARLRLERGANDFSEWLARECGETALAHAIARLDPYTYTLDGLRHQVVSLIRASLAKEGGQ
ncbi:DUF5752 family protein [Candidatus Binatia bacterium]|nr:DUF5752 family protein [Candidatus Binatia bacterium]